MEDVPAALREMKMYLELMKSKMIPEPDDDMRYVVALDTMLHAYR